MNRQAASAGHWVWVDPELPQAEARAQLDAAIKDTHPKGTPWDWAWSIEAHRLAHRSELRMPSRWRWRLALFLKDLRRFLLGWPLARPHPPPLILYPFTVFRILTDPTNGPPAPAPLREVAGVT